MERFFRSNAICHPISSVSVDNCLPYDNMLELKGDQFACVNIQGSKEGQTAAIDAELLQEQEWAFADSYSLSAKVRSLARLDCS